MKFINYRDLAPTVAGYYIDTFDLVGKKVDQEIFMKIINSLFKEGDELFFICEKAGGFKKESELRIALSKHKAELYVLPELENEKKYRCFFRFFYENKPGFIAGIWKEFDTFFFFKPSLDLDWNTFTSYGHNLFDIDAEAIRMFAFNFMDFICIRGAGGESLVVNYRKAYSLPDIGKLIEIKKR